MITQCEIRKLYADKTDPAVKEAIELAKTFERRRCGHHPDEYPEPLSTEECLLSVVDPKGSGLNKHRYVVACQDTDLRRLLRTVRGTPLVYIKRSVMILEPMADETAQVRAREERSKFRAEIKNALGKRKRDKDDEEEDGSVDGKDRGHGASIPAKDDKKKKKGKGPKGPNPLSMKKAKKATQDPSAQNKSDKSTAGTETTAPAKRKRRRKSKAKGDGDATETKTTEATTASQTADSE